MRNGYRQLSDAIIQVFYYLPRLLEELQARKSEHVNKPRECHFFVHLGVYEEGGAI